MSQLAEAVRLAVPNGRLVASWPLSGGISAQMRGLTVAFPDGQQQKFVLRQHSPAALQHDPNLTANEFRLLQILADHALPTARPHHLFAKGAPFERPALLLDFVEGEMRFVHADPITAVEQMAEQLAAVHQIRASVNDLSFLPQQTAAFAASIRRRTAGEDVLGVEAKLLATVGQISTLKSDNEPVLLHGDFWPGNVLWQGTHLAAIIDWEDAMVGDPLTDLAKARGEIVWIFGIEALQAFTARYRALSPLLSYDQLPLWDLRAVLRFIRLSQDGLSQYEDYFGNYGRFDITPDPIRANCLYFVNQALKELNEK